MRVRWALFESEDRRAEAQIWEPAGGTGKIILFCPGFPGVGAGLFEQRHAAALVENGYAVAVIRHAGTRLDTPSAPLMINNAARLMQARGRGEMLLGGGPSSVADWLLEPLTVLKNISDGYEDIFIFGNSFGALSALWSVTDPRAPRDRVRHILLQAGAQGVSEDGGLTDVMRIWRPEFLLLPRITEKVALDSPSRTVATIRDVYASLPGRVMGVLPPAVRLTFLVVEKDELLRLQDTEKFRAAIGGRGEIVIDSVDRAYPEHALIAHDMPDYPTENFLSLLL